MDTNQTVGAAAQLSGDAPTVTESPIRMGLVMNRKNRRTLESLVRRRKPMLAVERGFSYGQIMAEATFQGGGR